MKVKLIKNSKGRLNVRLEAEAGDGDDERVDLKDAALALAKGGPDGVWDVLRNRGYKLVGEKRTKNIVTVTLSKKSPDCKDAETPTGSEHSANAKQETR